MVELMEALGVWKAPAYVITIVLIIFLAMQVIGEITEWCGKVVPEFLKVRKYFKRKKKEKQDKDDLLKNVQKLLTEVHKHYDEDNIKKRDTWMDTVNQTISWVHKRADDYDKSIDDLKTSFAEATEALNKNTELTEEIFVQNSRDRIIEFATRAGDYDLIISREEFNRIFKVYMRYESFLESHNRENGEVETNYAIILDGYDYRVRNHAFLEDIRLNLKKNT